MQIRNRLVGTAGLASRKTYDAGISVGGRLASAVHVVVGVHVDREIEQGRKACGRSAGPHEQRADGCAVGSFHGNVFLGDIAPTVVFSDQDWVQRRESAVGFRNLIVGGQL